MTASVTRSLILVLMPAVAWAQATIDFRGVPLGASEAQFLAVLPGFHCRPAPAQGDAVADRICLPDTYPENRTFGGAETSTLFVTFMADRMVGLMAVFKTRDFDKVRDALREKYGAPISTDHPEFQTRGGVRTPNEVVTWRRGSGVVIARRYGGAINEGVVHYADENAIAAAKSRSQDAAKKNAKSL